MPVMTLYDVENKEQNIQAKGLEIREYLEN